MSKAKSRVFSILVLILIILFAISICPFELQNDTFYTIKIGEYIMQNGISVLQEQQDPFSWHEDLPYTYPHWAYDVLMYNIYNIGGFIGINVFTALLACILFLSVYYINCKLIKNKATSFIITILTAYLMEGFIAARAQLLTFIFFVWVVYFIERFLETKKIKYGVVLIIISTIIANIHVAVWPFFFILFLPYIGEYIISFVPNIGIWFNKFRIKRLSRILGKGKIKSDKIILLKEKINKLDEKNIKIAEKNKKTKEKVYKINVVRNPNVKWLILIAIICSLTGFLTPLGFTPYTYLINTLQGNTMSSISEHLPLTLIEATDFSIYVFLFLALLIFTDSKIRLKDLFMSFGLLYMALSSRRQMSMFILIGGIVIHRLICYLLDKYFKRSDEKLQKHMLKIPGIVITIGVVFVGCLYMIRGNVSKEIVNPYTYPVEASNYILENIDIENMKIFNEYNYGSYLLFRGIPVFVDSRADLYAPEFNGGRDIFMDFINTSGIGVYYEDKFKEYGITHVIVYKNSKLNMFLSRNKNYNLLYSDDSFNFYERLEEQE